MPPRTVRTILRAQHQQQRALQQQQKQQQQQQNNVRSVTSEKSNDVSNNYTSSNRGVTTTTTNSGNDHTQSSSSSSSLLHKMSSSSSSSSVAAAVSGALAAVKGVAASTTTSTTTTTQSLSVSKGAASTAAPATTTTTTVTLPSTSSENTSTVQRTNSTDGLSPMFAVQLTQTETSTLKSRYHTRASAKRSAIPALFGGNAVAAATNNTKGTASTETTTTTTRQQQHASKDLDPSLTGDESSSHCLSIIGGSSNSAYYELIHQQQLQDSKSSNLDDASSSVMMMDETIIPSKKDDGSVYQRTSGSVVVASASATLTSGSELLQRKSTTSSSTSAEKLNGSSLRSLNGYKSPYGGNSSSLNNGTYHGGGGSSSVASHRKSSRRQTNNNTASSPSPSLYDTTAILNGLNTAAANANVYYAKTLTLLPFYLRVVFAFIVFNFVWLILFSNTSSSTSTARNNNNPLPSSSFLLSNKNINNNIKSPDSQMMSASDILTKDELQKLQSDYRSNKNINSNKEKGLIFDTKASANDNNQEQQQQERLSGINIRDDTNHVEELASSGLSLGGRSVSNGVPLVMNGKAETPLHFELNHDLGVLKLTAEETVKKLEDAQLHPHRTTEQQEYNETQADETPVVAKKLLSTTVLETDQNHIDHHNNTVEKAANLVLGQSYQHLDQQQEHDPANPNPVVAHLINTNRDRFKVTKGGWRNNNFFTNSFKTFHVDGGRYDNSNNLRGGIDSQNDVDTSGEKELHRGTKHKLEDGDDNILLVIISNRLEGIIPSIASIIEHATKKVDVVLVGDHDLNEIVHHHFGARINHFTSMTVKEVAEDLQSNGYNPIWTWPEWHSSIRDPKWTNEHTIHIADWDSLPTHAHELNHLRFYLPYISLFQNKGYLYFIDDDILVRKDLGPVAKDVMKDLPSDKGLVSPCNIWIWDTKCQNFNFHDRKDLILNSPSLYGDRNICKDPYEMHCYPESYIDFIRGVLPSNGAKQEAWNFGFSLFALNNWRKLQLTYRYETVMRRSYMMHVYPETSLTFGLGVAYLAFAGAVECWDEKKIVVRDGFGFIEYDRYETTFGKGFYDKVDVVHFTGPEKPWVANSTIEVKTLQPWLEVMANEKLPIPDQLPTEPSRNLFTVLASDRTGVQWMMHTLDSHPQICASGETKKPETGFSSDALLPTGLPWYPSCSVKRGCAYSFIAKAIAELLNDIPDRRMRQIPRRCMSDYDPVASNDPYTEHLTRLCNFMAKLQGNYTKAAIGRVWVEAFVNEDKSLVGCTCSRGTLAKGLKIQPEWLTYENFPDENRGPPQLELDDSLLHGSKVIRLKRRNLWARYKSMVMAQKSGQYHLQSAEAKQHQENSTEKIQISVEDLEWTINHMINIDKFGDEWAKKHASDVLYIDYEDCRDHTASCFKKIFEFLGVNPNYVDTVGKKFESTFADLHLDESLDNIKNRESVREALAVNGWGHFIGLDGYQEIQLLIYDENDTLAKPHQVTGINSTLYGFDGRNSLYRSKFNAAVPLLQSMPATTMVVVTDDRNVIIDYPSGPDALRYEAISKFRQAFTELTMYKPNAVVVSAEPSCCASALTHVTPGAYYSVNNERVGHSCLSGSIGCQWADENKARTWKSMMQDIASRRGQSSSNNIYLDGGLIAGRASDLLQLISQLQMENFEDDRAVLTDFMYRNPDKILLDYETKLFGKALQHRSAWSRDEQCGNQDVTSSADLRRLATPDNVVAPLFIHRPRQVSCGRYQNSPIQRFPRWEKEGIHLRPLLEHIRRILANGESLIQQSYQSGNDVAQGPEIPYVIDDTGVFVSSTIRNRTNEAINEVRLRPTEALFKLSFRILKKIRTPVEKLRWSNLVRVVEYEAGFPFWAWYGDYKLCNRNNYRFDSIPLLTTAVTTDCNYAFPIPNFMTIIDAHRDSEEWNTSIRRLEEKYPWENKLRKAVWRGSLTEDNWRALSSNVRWRLCKMVFESRSNLFDVGITSIPKHITDNVYVNVREIGGLVDSITPMSEFMRYAAIIDMDGTSWSPRFGSLLCFNSVIVKVEPKYSEYFFADLLPWTHYIPVKSDLSDLYENVQWAMDPKNEIEVKNIVAAANKFCSQRFTSSNLAYDLLDMWESYVHMLDQADPKWSQNWRSVKGKLFAPDSAAEMVLA